MIYSPPYLFIWRYFSIMFSYVSACLCFVCWCTSTSVSSIANMRTCLCPFSKSKVMSYSPPYPFIRIFFSFFLLCFHLPLFHLLVSWFDGSSDLSWLVPTFPPLCNIKYKFINFWSLAKKKLACVQLTSLSFYYLVFDLVLLSILKILAVCLSNWPWSYWMRSHLTPLPLSNIKYKIS